MTTSEQANRIVNKVSKKVSREVEISYGGNFANERKENQGLFVNYYFGDRAVFCDCKGKSADKWGKLLDRMI